MSIVEEQQLLTGELRGRDATRRARERMLGPRHEEERIARDDLLLDVADVGFEGDDRTLDLAVRELLHERFRLVLEPFDPEARERLAKR